MEEEIRGRGPGPRFQKTWPGKGHPDEGQGSIGAMADCAMATFQRADGASCQEHFGAAAAMDYLCLDYGDAWSQLPPCQTAPGWFLGRSRTGQPGAAYPAITGHDST